MKIEYSITGSVDIPPALLALMEASGKPPGEYVRELFLTADTLPAFLSGAQITVDSSESVAHEFGSRGTGLTAVPRSNEGGMAPKRSAGPGKRMGRPKTLTDMEASDGGPVREWGDRSPEVLHAAGISTRFANGEDQWVPELPEKKPVRKAAPATKGYRPPVVARQRGK